MKTFLTNAFLAIILLVGSLYANSQDLPTMAAFFLIVAVAPGYTLYEFITVDKRIAKTIELFKADPKPHQVDVKVSLPGSASNDFTRWAMHRVNSYQVVNEKINIPRNIVTVNYKPIRAICDQENGYLLIQEHLTSQWTAYKIKV